MPTSVVGVSSNVRPHTAARVRAAIQRAAQSAVNKTLRGLKVRYLTCQRRKAKRGKHQRHPGAERAATAELDAKSDESQFFKPPLAPCSGQVAAPGAAETQELARRCTTTHVQPSAA